MKKTLKYAACLPLAVLLTVACNKNEEKVTPPSGENNVVLEFMVSDVRSTSAVIEVTPAKDTVSYYWSVMPSKDYSALDGTEALWDRDMSRFNELAAERGVSVEEIIAEETVKGGVKETVTGLMPETEYVAYGYGLSASGTSNVISLEHFTTSEEGVADEEARVTVEIGEARMTQIDVSYVPESMDVMYYPNYIDDDTYQSYGGNLQGVIDYFDATLIASANHWGVTVEELVATLINRGTMNQTYDDLAPESTYWFFVAELDGQGNVLSMDCKSATTTERIMTDFSIELNIDSCKQTNISISAYPSDPDQPYFMELFPISTYMALGGGDSEEDDARFMQAIIEMQTSTMEELCYTGDQVGTFWNLPSESDFMLVAFAYNDEAWTSPLYKVPCSTTAIIDPQYFEADINILALSEVQVKAAFIPNDNMVTFHLHYMLKSEFDSYSSPKEAIQADFDQWVQSWLDTYPEDDPATWEQVVANLGRRGPREYTETMLRPGTEYILWAAAFSQNGKILSEPSIEEFTTVEWSMSEDITVTPILGEYYDAGSVAPFYTGHIFQIFEGVETQNAATWWVGFFKGDYTANDDAWFASRLIMNGTQDRDGRSVAMLYWDYDLEVTEWTACAIARDADGKWGPAYKQLLRFTQDGCADPSTFPEEFLDETGMLRDPAAYTPSPLMLQVPVETEQPSVVTAVPVSASDVFAENLSTSFVSSAHVFPLSSAQSQPEALPSFRIE